MNLLLNVFPPQSGKHGFNLVGNANTAEADFCKSIAADLFDQQVSIETDRKKNVVVIRRDGLSINFLKESGEIEKIEAVLQGHISVESYADGEFAGCMIVSR